MLDFNSAGQRFVWVWLLWLTCLKIHGETSVSVNDTVGALDRHTGFVDSAIVTVMEGLRLTL